MCACVHVCVLQGGDLCSVTTTSGLVCWAAWFALWSCSSFTRPSPSAVASSSASSSSMSSMSASQVGSVGCWSCVVSCLVFRQQVMCISEIDLFGQFWVLPLWDRSCRCNLLSCPVTVHWHLANWSFDSSHNYRHASSMVATRLSMLKIIDMTQLGLEPRASRSRNRCLNHKVVVEMFCLLKMCVALLCMT